MEKESVTLKTRYHEKATPKKASFCDNKDSGIAETSNDQAHQLKTNTTEGVNEEGHSPYLTKDVCKTESTPRAKDVKQKGDKGKGSRVKVLKGTKSEKLKNSSDEILPGASKRKTRKRIYTKPNLSKKSMDIAASEPQVKPVKNGKDRRQGINSKPKMPCLENELICLLPVQAIKVHNNAVAEVKLDVNGEQEPSADKPMVKPEEGFMCGLRISSFGGPNHQSELLKSTQAVNIDRTLSSSSGFKSTCKSNELRLGLGYNRSLSGINTSPTVLDTLTVKGSGFFPSEQLLGKHLFSESPKSQANVQENFAYNETDIDEMNPSKRRRTVPTILARSKSRVTVRELLEKSRKMSQPPDTDFGEVPHLDVGKTQILPTTIPPKHASLSLSLTGRQVEVPTSAEGISSYSFSTSVSSTPLISKRYKNTRYSVPFKGPTMIVPKNYNTTDTSLDPSYSIKNPATFLLPRLDENDSNVIRETYKRTGKITSLPAMSIGTIGSLSSICPVSEPQNFKTGGKDDKGFTINPKVENSNSFPKPKVPSKSRLQKPSHLMGVQTLPELEVSVKANFKDGSKQLLNSEDKALDVFESTNIKRREFTSIKDYFETESANFRTFDSIQRQENCSGVYRHPFIGMFSEMLAKSQRQRRECTTSHLYDSETVSAGSSHSAILPSQTSSLNTKSSSNCVYCEIEKQYSNAHEESDEDPSSLPDHAYTKTSESSPSKFPFYINPPASDVTRELPKLLNTSLTSNQIPVYAYRCGEQLLLFPNLFPPGDPIAPSTTPDLKFNKDLPRDYRNRAKTSGTKPNRRQKIRKSKRHTKASPSKLDFVNLVELAPVTATKSRRSNLERVVANIQRQKCGNFESGSVSHNFVAKIIQIERSSDSVFTQISNYVKLELHDGADPLLKRWQDHEDYSARIIYDNISGAIKIIEADTLKPGFFIMVKTGIVMSDEQDTKTLATLQSSIPSTNTILNNSTFIAVGKIFKCNDSNVQKQPPCIQKHTNLDYLLRSLKSICVIDDVIEHVSDRSYVPKIDSPKWYTRKSFDSFSYKRQMKT